MGTELRSDKYVCNNMTGDFALYFGETIRHTQEGIEVINKFPGDAGTLLITNFRMFWFSQTNPNRNVSIGFMRVIAVGKRKINSGEPEETHVACVLTYDGERHREYKFKNSSNLQDVQHIKVFMDIFRSYTSTKLYRDVLTDAEVIENKQLRLLPYEQVFTTVEGVEKLSNERVMGTFILTNIRCVWFSEDNELENVSFPYLCVEKVNIIPSEFGEAVVLEVEDEDQLFGWTFRVEPQEKQQFLLGHLCNLLVQFNESPIVGF